MGFSPSEKHYTTTSILSNIVDASTGTFTEGLTVSGTPVTGSPQYIQIEHQASPGTQGGTLTADGWRTRPLTNIVEDETGSVTLSSNQITLPAGSYIFSAAAPGYAVNQHMVRLRDITNSVTIATGPPTYSASDGKAQTNADAWGQFTIAASTVFELQQISTATEADSGMGLEISPWLTGDFTERFAVIAFSKIA